MNMQGDRPLSDASYTSGMETPLSSSLMGCACQKGASHAHSTLSGEGACVTNRRHTPVTAQPMTTLRALIVEDNPVILNNLIATLEELADLRVVGTAGNEKEALHELKNRAPELDLVIIDIFLTSGSGLGVLKYARDIELAARRVVLTNYATPDMRQRCVELGADQVFDKSSELDELIEYCDQLAKV